MPAEPIRPPDDVRLTCLFPTAYTLLKNDIDTRRADPVQSTQFLNGGSA